MKNSYELHGRALKVHFDKFSHSLLAATNSSYNSTGPQQPNYPYAQSSMSQGDMFSNASSQPTSRSSSPPIPTLLINPLTNGHQNGQVQQPAPSSIAGFNDQMARQFLKPVEIPFSLSLPSQSSLPLALSSIAPPVSTDSSLTPTSASSTLAKPLLSINTRDHPNRIVIPPPFSSTNPFSPMHRIPLMTPSMPAFTLRVGAHGSAMTPPVYHETFSPGAGAFSPDGNNGSGRLWNQGGSKAPGMLSFVASFLWHRLY